MDLSFDGMEDFSATSIWREKKEGTIRFWQKGTHAAGSGCIHSPVLYLIFRQFCLELIRFFVYLQAVFKSEAVRYV